MAWLLGACTFTPPELGDDDPGEGMPPPGEDDADGDGVGAVDNCPAVANPAVMTLGFEAAVQRDHDRDGRGDECDLCPHIASEADADGDADGIGDACDPEPEVANPPPYWNGFYEAPSSEWSASSGAVADWEVAERDGKIGWRQTVLDGSARHQLLLAGERAEHYVQTSLVVEQIAPRDTDELRSATVSYGYRPRLSGDEYFSCGVRWDSAVNTGALAIARHVNDGNQSTAEVAWGPTSLVGLAIDVTARGEQGATVASSALRCVGVHGPQPGDVRLASNQPAGQIGLRTFGMVAWFDYLFVVEPRPRE